MKLNRSVEYGGGERSIQRLRMGAKVVQLANTHVPFNLSPKRGVRGAKRY